MTKKLACGDLMPGCDFVAEAETEDEILAIAAEHARTAHGMATIPEEVLAKVKAAIKDA